MYVSTVASVKHCLLKSHQGMVLQSPLTFRQICAKNLWGARSDRVKTEKSYSHSPRAGEYT